MAFQFLCPQGHLLQSDPSQMGRTITCPTCGTLFIVPTVTTAVEVPAVAPAPPRVPLAHPAATRPTPPPAATPVEEDDGLHFDFRKRPSRRFAHLDAPAADDVPEEAFPEVTSSSQAAFDPEAAGPKLVHVYCPGGHELITPMDTMGQDVLCPHCGEQFRLSYQESKEYKEERFWKEEARQQKLGKNWLMWAVIAGVAVLVMLVVMIIFSAQ